MIKKKQTKNKTMKSKSIVFHSYLFIEGAVRSALSRMNMSILWWVTYLEKFVNVLSAIVSLLFFLIKQILNLHVSSFFYKIRSRFFYYHFVIMYIILLLFYLPSNDFFLGITWWSEGILYIMQSYTESFIEIQSVSLEY